MAGEPTETLSPTETNSIVDLAANLEDKAAVAEKPTESKPCVKREDLWVNALERTVDGSVIQMTGIGSAEQTVFSHVSSGPSCSINTVLRVIVDEGWKDAAKTMLENKQQKRRENMSHTMNAADAYPSAPQLLHLGAVWLLNETSYTQKRDAHARRLGPQDGELCPDWNDMTLRVHYVPDRFHAAHQVDWTKYCRGLLVDNKVQARIGDEIPHVPVLEGMPDMKDGVIVYEDEKLGFAILNKPGNMPIHASISNHAEDVVSLFHAALVERRNKHSPHVTKTHVSVLPRFSISLDTETSGLLAVATRSEFSSYLTKVVDKKPSDPLAFNKKFRCLVCIKKPETMDVLEDYQATGKIVTHYLDTQCQALKKKFVYHKPNDHHKNWAQCQMRILKVGDDRFRAACVQSIYKDSVDACLAHRLWGPASATPAEDLGVQYVMELEVELITNRKHQIRGQLAALGCPIVGDELYGGGKCDVHAERHTWYRMALQCCELSFMEPRWNNASGNSNKETPAAAATTTTAPAGNASTTSEKSNTATPKKELVPGERKCVFRLNEAWWTDYLHYYEMLVLRTSNAHLTE